MSCTCNNESKLCEPCAFCTPPGVTCLPDCNPQDPCEQKIDLCCVENSGPDYPCSEITHGESLCDLLVKFLDIEFPASDCCTLEMSIDILPAPLPTTTTTSSTSTTTSSTSTSTSTSSTSTTSTTTTTTVLNIPRSVAVCFSRLLTGSCLAACNCPIPTTEVWTNSLPILANSVLYTSNTLTTFVADGYYSDGTSCYFVTGGIGRVFGAPSTCAGTPARSTLTFSQYQCMDGDGRFLFTISNPIPVAFTIGGAKVYGYTQTNCGDAPPIPQDALPANAITVLANATSAIVSTSTPLGCTIKRYKRFDGFIINGVTQVINGSHITIGGVDVTIVIDSTTCEIFNTCC